MSLDRYHHGDLRAALIAATRRLLLEHDPETLSLRQAAREVGVSANAPYRHFADKDALMAAVAAEGFRSLTEEFRQTATAPSGRKRLEAIGVEYCRFVDKEPSLLRVMFGPRLRAVAQHPMLDESEREAFAELVFAVEETTDGAEPERAIRTAVGIWSLIHGFATLRADGALAFLDKWMLPSPSELVRALRRGAA